MHEILSSVIEAQRQNALLAGADLQAVAVNVVALCSRTGYFVRAADAVGERIIGAALAISSDINLFDYTVRFPDHARCLLVGGHVAGVVGVQDAAISVRRAGASHVDAAMISDSPGLVEAIDTWFNVASRVRVLVA